MRLEGKVAIVAGAAWGGIGGATALRFAQEGAKVVVNTRRREGKMDETLQRIRDAGGDCVGVMGDASQEETWKELVQTALDHYGKVTTMLYNAAGGTFQPLIDIPLEDWNRALAGALTGPWLAAKYCIPEMTKAGGGSIIFMSSVNGSITNPRFTGYSAGKGGVNALARSIALDYGHANIRCNTVSPGQIVGERETPFLEQDKLEDWACKDCYPLGRYGKPEEIANAVLFLASDEASFVTGINMTVDGGLTIQSPEALVRPSFRRRWRPYTLVPQVVSEEERKNFAPPKLPEGYKVGDMTEEMARWRRYMAEQEAKKAQEPEKKIMKWLEGKVAIVAGAAWGGIGGASAFRFAQEGAKVVVNTRSRENKMDETLQRIRDIGGECVGVMGDASEEETWKTLVQTALEHYGKLTTLVFNAAQSFVKPAIELTMDEWNRALGVSLTGPFIAAKYCLPEMIKAGGGAIVMISTVNSFITNPGFGVYGASKGGLNALTRTIALDYGDRGIRCNTIAPGQVVGERGAAFYEQDKLEDWASKECYPRREYGRPMEIANAALFLASDEASFVTGVLLPVDGGLTIQSPEALVRPSFRRSWRPYTLVPKLVNEDDRHHFAPPPLSEGEAFDHTGSSVALSKLLDEDEANKPQT